ASQLSVLRTVDESAAPPPINATMPPITVRMPLVTRLRKRRRLTSAVAVSTMPVAIGTLEDPLLGNRVLVFLAVLVEPAIPLEHFEVLVDVAIEDEVHFPGLREDVGILNRRFILDVIAIDGRVALNHVRVLGVEVAGMVEPGLFNELPHVDDERVALPLA